MTKRRLFVRIGMLVMWVVPGMMMLGTSCAYDARKSMVAAGLDFIKHGAGLVLTDLIPLDQILAGK